MPSNAEEINGARKGYFCLIRALYGEKEDRKLGVERNINYRGNQAIPLLEKHETKRIIRHTLPDMHAYCAEIKPCMDLPYMTAECGTWHTNRATFKSLRPPRW